MAQAVPLVYLPSIHNQRAQGIPRRVFQSSDRQGHVLHTHIQVGGDSKTQHTSTHTTM